MNFIRRSLVASLTSLLVFLLFALAFDFGLLHTVGSATSVKKILSGSGVYNSVVPNALKQAGQINTGAGSVNLADPNIQKAAQAAITPQQVQNYANQFIDSVFAWLNGQTAQPQFSLDLGSLKPGVADNISQAASQQAASLPKCTSLSQVSTDVFNETCLPPGVTPAAVASQARQQILNGQGFLDQPNLTASDIKNNGSNQSVFSDQLKNAPKQYQRLKKTPVILIILAVISAAGIVFLSSTRRRGVQRVAWALVGVGIFMLLFAWGLNKATASQILPRVKLNNAAASQEFKTVIKAVERGIDKNYVVFGVIYAAVGAAALAGLRFLPRVDKDLAAVHAEPIPSSKPSTGTAEKPVRPLKN